MPRPSWSFGELDRRLEAAGWLLGAENQEPPLVAGEPHWCEFWRRDRDARITYTFNPAVRLRVLAFAGADSVEARAEVAATIPRLDSVAVRALLDGDDERARLLGLLAAAAMHDAAVLDRVRELEHDDDARVAAAAAHAREQILPAPLAAALEMLVGAKRAHPDRSVLFTHYGGPEQRRQILRWLVHDFEATNPVDRSSPAQRARRRGSGSQDHRRAGRHAAGRQSGRARHCRREASRDDRGRRGSPARGACT